MIQGNKVPGQIPTLTMRPMANHPYRISTPAGTSSDPSKAFQDMLLMKRPASQIPVFKPPLPATMTRPPAGISFLRPQLPSDSRIVYHAPIFSKRLPADVRRHIASQLAREFNIRKNLQLKKQLLMKDSEGTHTEKNVLTKAKELRARLKAEIENRAKTCAFTAHKCSLPRVHGFQFCMNHILQDPRAPYRQCTFVYTNNGKRCTNAAPKIDYAKHPIHCFEHSRYAQRVRSRTMARWMPPKSLDTTLAQLSHYLAPMEAPQPAPIYFPGAERIKREIMRKDVNVRTDENGKLVPLDPMFEINIEAVEKSRNALSYASESDSDDEPALYGDVNQSLSYLASDDESVEDNSTDPLKHAGIYTAEEANTFIRDKLSRLQTLYVEQFRLLRQELKLKKSKLMPSLKREQETLCSVQDQPKDSNRELSLYKKLKACKRYYKKTGLEAVLYDRSLERRARQQMESYQHKNLHQTGPKCIFTEGGVKCTDKQMLCSKYCRKHILEDKRQILFKPCGVEIGGVICREPITGLLEVDTCPLHYKIPEPRTYNIRMTTPTPGQTYSPPQRFSPTEIFQKESTDSEHSEEDLSTNPDSPGENHDIDISTVKDEMDINVNEDISVDVHKGHVNVDVKMDIKMDVKNINVEDNADTKNINVNADDNIDVNNKNMDVISDVNMDINMDLDVAECDVVTVECREENVQEEIVETEEIPLS